jgi:hypothetical protein
MQETKKRYFSTFAVAILVGLTILLAQIITLGPSILLGTIGFLMQNAWILGIANGLLFIGLIVSLILTTRWTLYYMLAPYAAILDRAKNKQALKKSRALTEGKFWSVLARILLPKFVFLLFGVLITMLLSLVINIFLIGSTGLNIDVQLRITELTEAVLPMLILIFLNPLIFLSDVLLYQNLTEQTGASSDK